MSKMLGKKSHYSPIFPPPFPPPSPHLRSPRIFAKYFILGDIFIYLFLRRKTRNLKKTSHFNKVNFWKIIYGKIGKFSKTIESTVKYRNYYERKRKTWNWETKRHGRKIKKRKIAQNLVN